MARRAPLHPLPLLVIIGAVINTGDALSCNVCIPQLTGDHASIRQAREMRANISRLFPGEAEENIQECGAAVDINKQNTLKCPWDDDSVVCLDVKHSSWQALTCGRVPVDENLQCWECCGGALVCPCPGENCNSGAGRTALTADPRITGLLVTAAALLSRACR